MATAYDHPMGERPPVYIVTGGAGFIGAALVATLQRDEPEARIHVVDDFSTGSHANLVEQCDRLGCGPFRGSVMPDAVGDLNWQPALIGLEPTAVFHLAAITDTLETDERKMLAVNTESFRDLLDACLECAVPLVYASSAATYGSPAQADRSEPFPEDAAGSPNNVYGFSKWLMDVESSRVLEEARAAGEDAPHVVGLRYFNVFGPGEARKGRMASMVHHLTHQILGGQRPRLFEHGHHERDQVHVDDVVAGTLAAARSGVTPGVYNLGSGVATSFNDMADAINEGLGTGGGPEYIPMPREMVPTYQHFTLADLTRTRSALGWAPALDPLDAIRDTARWIASRTADAPTPDAP